MPAPIQKIATIVLAKKDTAKFKAIHDYAKQQGKTKILSKNKVLEFKIGAVKSHIYQTKLKDMLLDMSIEADICVQPDKNRKKSLLICDMDSTLIGQECIDELADFAGVKKRVSAITERAMRGEIGFEDALKKRVLMLRGLPLSVLRECYEQRITLNPGAKTLAQTMAANKAKTVIVSGGFTFFTSRIAIDAGFDDHQANILQEGSGHLTGTVKMPILGREAKHEALMHYSQKKPLNAIAIGDGANDLAMITAAGLGIAYRAKPAVATAAHCAINHTDLTTALYYQGYSESDFKVD